MHRKVRLKYWLFENYSWLLSIGAVVAVAALLVIKEQIGTVATVVGALLSVAYFVQKQKLEELRLFREIFKECNGRYDQMNDALSSIAAKPSPLVTAAERAQVVDYLNLCGEEYLYFKRGYVEPAVWQAWQNGMKAIVAAPSIQGIWQEEKQTGSYYDLPL